MPVERGCFAARWPNARFAHEPAQAAASHCDPTRSRGPAVLGRSTEASECVFGECPQRLADYRPPDVPDAYIEQVMQLHRAVLFPSKHLTPSIAVEMEISSYAGRRLECYWPWKG